MWKRLKMRDFVLELCKCSGVSVFFSFFFYEGLWGLFITWSVGVWMYQKDKRKKRRKGKRNFCWHSFGIASAQCTIL